MRKGDILEQLRPEGAWTFVRNCVTGREGMVPSSFLAKAYSLEAEPWFFGPITRAKVRACMAAVTRIPAMCRVLDIPTQRPRSTPSQAEKLLGNPMRKHGCFLIRESESQPGTYSLSMKDGESVRHFRVTVVSGGKLRLQGVSGGGRGGEEGLGRTWTAPHLFFFLSLHRM
jgi:fyn-related kinase